MPSENKDRFKAATTLKNYILSRNPWSEIAEEAGFNSFSDPEFVFIFLEEQLTKDELANLIQDALSSKKDQYDLVRDILLS